MARRAVRTCCPTPAPPGATEAHALFGTPDELVPKFEALKRAGVAYVLLTILGGKEQLRRFAREIMPAIAAERNEVAGACQ